jgi:hypothetical protein
MPRRGPPRRGTLRNESSREDSFLLNARWYNKPFAVPIAPLLRDHVSSSQDVKPDHGVVQQMVTTY